MKKIFILWMKEADEYSVHFTLTDLFSDKLGVSKGKLDRFSFISEDFENELCTIRMRYACLPKRTKRKL